MNALLRDNGYDQSPQLEGRSDSEDAEGVPVNELVVLGTVLTVDHDRRTHTRGAVYIHDGRIERVADESQPAPAGYDDAPRVRVDGVVAPGLIDLHNHLAYNTLPLWVGRDDAYGTRYQWPRAASYGPDVSNPAQALGIAAPAAALRFAEVKAAVGGVTSIQGSPPLTRIFPGWMVRNVENEKLGQGQSIFQSVLPATDKQLDATAPRLKDGKAFIYHLAEGVDPVLRKEFTLLERPPLRARRAGGHPLDRARRRRLPRVEAEGRRRRRVVAVLEHLAVRRHHRRAERAPARPARVPRVRTGRLRGRATCSASSRSRVGGTGSRSVAPSIRPTSSSSPPRIRATRSRVRGRCRSVAWSKARSPTSRASRNVHADPWRAVLGATEKHVRLVIVGGRPVYGNRALLERAGVEHAGADHRCRRARAAS